MMMYEAKANMAVVTMFDGLKQVVIPDCKILGEGTATESSGVVIADGTRFWYIPLVTPSLKDAVTKMENLCDKLIALAGTLSTNAGTLLDNETIVTGQATMTPSVVKGTAIKTDATTVKNEANELKTQITNLANQLP